ncbi:ABC transporter type 1 transmembrane domain [Trinorchestia longiramus]|nr:ABC transporter type 1 transmembrane domain [Trinorchestia longiramus]
MMKHLYPPPRLPSNQSTHLCAAPVSPQSVLQLQEPPKYVGQPRGPLTAVQLCRATLAWPAPGPRGRLDRKTKDRRPLSPADKMLLGAQSPDDGWLPVLFDVDLSVSKGELLGVCGGVGAGKSSLLHAILGRMKLIEYTGKDENSFTQTEEISSQPIISSAKTDGLPNMKNLADGLPEKNNFPQGEKWSNSAEGSMVGVEGDIAYVGQQAWILNTTVRENILLGEAFDPLRYYRVVYACSLTQDLDALPAGDLTEVGERGINLSGGQKQRLSLARALYSKRSVYLLDDPLSAVDGEVGWHIFKWAIKTGLRHATVVLVTHQLQYLPECDRVVLLQKGRVVEQGTHEGLLQSGGEYAALYASHQNATNTASSNASNKFESSNNINMSTNNSVHNVSSAKPTLLGSNTDTSLESWRRRKRTVSCASTGSAAYGGNVAIGGPAVKGGDDPTTAPRYSPPPSRLSSSSENRRASSTAAETNKDPSDPQKGMIITEERLQSGTVPRSTYFAYINAAGGLCITAAVVASFGVNVGTTAFSSWWLSHWLSAGSGIPAVYSNSSSINYNNSDIIPDINGSRFDDISNVSYGNLSSTDSSDADINYNVSRSDNIADNPHLNFYLSVYGSTVVFILSTSLLRGVIFMKTSIHASTRLHDSVLGAVVKSPLSFFDTTPIGRILNIFSRDVDEVDVRLPMSLEMFMQNMWLISCSLLLVCLVFWQFLPILLLLAVIFMVIRNIFRIGIRDFKRLENHSRSPLYSHVSTTLSGLPTIHAFTKQKLFSDKFFFLFDESSTAFYLFNCGMRWLAIRLDMLALSVTACTALLTVLLRGQVEAAFAGLALAYASQLSGIFQYTVRLSTETEARFTSVERIQSYIETLESEERPSEVVPPSNWPTHGRICFRNVSMRYRHNTPLVFSDLSFDVHENEKIGVVGRTGSGKSSLGVCLFRLVELSGGAIRIDGTNIAKVSLRHLRSKLSVIPQDPVLFSGTLRYNLDPFQEHHDAAVWSALERVQLNDRVTKLGGGLGAPVAENGDNFSVGERQLICMARALLRDSKILLLDEATANIDTESDSLIQHALQTAFAHCTLISIAHRVNTILWCDRIMVMDAGSIVQFDAPANLAAQKDKPFAKMLKDAGAATAKSVSESSWSEI